MADENTSDTPDEPALTVIVPDVFHDDTDTIRRVLEHLKEAA